MSAFSVPRFSTLIHCIETKYACTGLVAYYSVFSQCFCVNEFFFSPCFFAFSGETV